MLEHNSNQCCGCGACASVCLKNAITMLPDKYGYLFPSIDYQKCISCGKCEKVCKFTESNYNAKKTSKVYAAASKDKDILSKSSSGGVFATVARKFIENGGIVYGAAWNEDFTVSHKACFSVDELKDLQGSKYTQSSIEGVFEEIKQNLDFKKEVLFSGTPCQVSSLYAFLGKSYDNLFTIDLICHGVPSNLMLQKDIKYFENRYKGNAKSVCFRDKKSGWGTQGSIIIGNKKHTYDARVSPYYYYYLKNAISRDSCYSCRFAGEGRQGDLTIGDYWRIETAHPKCNIDEKLGISCILVNDEKGEFLLSKTSDEFLLIPSTYEKISARNRQLVAPGKIPDIREKVLDLYTLDNYDELVNFWLKQSRKDRCLETVKHLVPNPLKRFIKRII